MCSEWVSFSQATYGGLGMGVSTALRALGHEVETAWVAEFDDAPARILAEHWPDAPNLGDVTKVDFSAVEQVDILTGGFPCFAAGTPVLTGRGLLPIEDVVVGDQVWTHEARWRPVTATMSREADTVEFRPGFYSTPEHLLWLRNPRKVWRNELRQYRRVLDAPDWVEANDSRGRFAATPIAIDVCGSDLPPGLDWWQVGRWLADGYAAPSSVFVYLGREKAGDAAKFSGWTVSETRTAIKLRLPASGAQASWLTEHFGSGAANKTLPAFVFGLHEDDRRALLAGYWSGDGYAFQKQSTRSASVSACLTIGMLMLAAGLGYTTSLHYNRTAATTVIEGRTVRQRDWWSVTATPDDGRFAERDRRWLWQKNRREVKPAGTRTVYDLTVADDHSFVAAGIVVHNCQDVSLAGRRAGMTEGTRSGLWSEMARAIDELRPGLVVIENVRGLLSASAGRPTADADMECCPICMGDAAGDDLRALGAVLGDLADLGFDAEWGGLEAAAVGAPHRRFRVFIVAWPADSSSGLVQRLGIGRELRSAPGAAQSEGDQRERGRRASRDRGEAAVSLFRTPMADEDGGGPLHPDVARERGQTLRLTGQVLAMTGNLLPTPQAHNAQRGKTQEQVAAMRARGHGVANLNEVIECELLLRSPVAPSATETVTMLPTPTSSEHTGAGHAGDGAPNLRTLVAGRLAHTDFGDYAPAVERWAAVIGRPAPAPTEPGARGGARLSPAFVEWMMGLPAGHVVGRGLSRTEELRALGNGVVPQQATAGVLELLGRAAA